MRFLMTAILALSLFPASALASDAVSRAEEAFNAAAKEMRQADLEALIADDFLYQHGSGKLLDKATFVNLLTTGGITVTRRGALNLSFRDYGDTVISYGDSELAGVAFGQPYDGRLRFVDVWRKSDGRWRMTHRNSELLPHAK
ncbi:MAG: nuclear transport factor 2 family protein [Hyphomicrobiales bacterium]|nr:nuclear transport factor 2 family protein [Hyphomicrobiales bacterium]